MAERWVGRSIPQVDIDDKLTGRTSYLADQPARGALVGVVVRSTVAHGHLRGIDVAAAKRVPGVRAVATAADVPEVSFGPYVPDWEVFARHKVRFIGDELAAVAATTLDAALRAAELIVADIEPLPAVFEAEDALAPGAPVLWDERPDNVASRFDVERGDVDAAFARAAHVVEGTFTTSRIYHGYLEPISVEATAHDDGTYTLVVPSHIPHKARITYAAGLGVDIDRIRIIVPPIGGSFGAKYEMTVPLIAAVLSRKAAAPVRIVYDREEDAANNHPRPPFSFVHRLAVDDDGRFVGRDVEVIGVAGGRTYWAPTVLATAVHRADSLYHFGTMRGHGRLVYTNDVPTTCMRGFGNAEALFGIEQLVDQLARETGIDPVELRLRNIVRAGETTLHGWRISSSALPECLERADELSGFRARRSDPVRPLGEDDVSGDEVRTGVGLAIGHHVSGYKTILKDFDGSSAIVRVGMDGRPVVYVGEPDLGQGLLTVLAQLVADGLGVTPGDVSVRGVDSDLSPAAVGTLASRATTLAGMAVVRACESVQQRLVELMADEWGADVAAVRWEDGGVVGPGGIRATFAEAADRYGRARCGLPLLGEGVYKPPTEFPDEDKYGNPSAAYPFTAHVAEVEVRPASGQVRVTRYWAVHDSGTVINPATARSQVVGAVAQGIGWCLLEDVVLGQGVMRNANFLDYRIPGAGDMPAMVVEFVDSYEDNGPVGAKSLGEAAINPVVAAIANAVFDAVGVRCTDLPFTPEVLWGLLQGRSETVAMGAGS